MKVLTGIPIARANPKSASFNAPWRGGGSASLNAKYYPFCVTSVAVKDFHVETIK